MPITGAQTARCAAWAPRGARDRSRPRPRPARASSPPGRLRGGARMGHRAGYTAEARGPPRNRPPATALTALTASRPTSPPRPPPARSSRSTCSRWSRRSTCRRASTGPRWVGRGGGEMGARRAGALGAPRRASPPSATRPPALCAHALTLSWPRPRRAAAGRVDGQHRVPRRDRRAAAQGPGRAGRAGQPVQVPQGDRRHLCHRAARRAQRQHHLLDRPAPPGARRRRGAHGARARGRARPHARGRPCLPRPSPPRARPHPHPNSPLLEPQPHHTPTPNRRTSSCCATTRAPWRTARRGSWRRTRTR
jgi:hypothetical protein